MSGINIEDLQLEDGFARSVTRRAPYLRGPISWTWLSRCAQLPGRALHVGLALWFEAGMRKSNTVVLRPKHRGALGVDRHAARRALILMERAGLVRVSHAPGRAHVVVILDVDREVAQ